MEILIKEDTTCYVSLEQQQLLNESNKFNPIFTQTLKFARAKMDQFAPMMKKPLEWVELEATIKKFIQISYCFQEWK